MAETATHCFAGNASLGISLAALLDTGAYYQGLENFSPEQVLGSRIYE